MTIKKPPVVVVLGHIDHGKSTLLDTIRKTNSTEKEAGGITQSIGAYQVEVKMSSTIPSECEKLKVKSDGEKITFIDTPGHSAFEKMRSHGAKAADIAILVVAADEGVKPQTIEAIKDIKEANLPFIVALNKIDKPEANSSKVKKELSEHGVFVEGYGGDISTVEISAKNGKGIPELFDLITLMAEVEGLKADPTIPAKGVVIVSSSNAKQGIITTLIIKDGTLREGDHVKFQTTYGKIRAMYNSEGKRMKEAGPSYPVTVIGLEALPEIGETFFVTSTLKEAQKNPLPPKEYVPQKKFSPQDNVVKLILKANEKASLDAMQKLLSQTQLQFPDIHFQIIETGVGDVSLSNIDFAAEFRARILGFQVHIPGALKAIARQKHIQLDVFTIIYELPKIIENIAHGFSFKEEKPLNETVVLAVFSKQKKEQVIGGKVTNGAIRKGVLLQIKRDGSMLGKGRVINIQHIKKDVGVVEAGKEYGMIIDSETEIKVGDILFE